MGVLREVREEGEVGMTDREKVIQGLECCGFSRFMDKCQECPYDGKDCFRRLKTDALTLLKREGEGAVWKYYLNDEGRARWRCSYCGKVCHRNPHDKRYCSICGKVMRMEG